MIEELLKDLEQIANARKGQGETFAQSDVDADDSLRPLLVRLLELLDRETETISGHDLPAAPEPATDLSSQRLDDHIIPIEHEDMLKACDEARLILSSVALYTARKSKGISRAAYLQTDPGISGPIVQGSSGLVYARVDDCIIILLPQIESRVQANVVNLEIQKVFDSFGSKYDWAIDFSAIDSKLPILFYGTILAYRQDLDAQGRSLSLCWLRPGILTGAFFQSVREAFGLMMIGGYWFSVDD